MRILAIGDIHGCRKALETMADFVGFNEGDRIITLGDYVNKGPDSKGVLDFLIDLEQTQRLIALRGNHEIVMLRSRYDLEARKTWLGESFCGAVTLASYQTDDIASIPQAHWDFLERTQTYHEEAAHFFVHASVDPQLPLSDQGNFMPFWAYFSDAAPHLSGKIMVCGHSEIGDVPKHIGHAICIDTKAYGGGWLTCLDVTSGQFWQTNEQGKTRKNILTNLSFV